MHLTDDQIREISTRVEAENLPGDLADVATFIGEYPALLLAYKIGGVVIYLRKWNDDQSLWSDEIKLWVEVVGLDNTATIVRLFDGDYINIPKCESLFLKYRNELIRNEASSKTKAELARDHSLSDRHIKRIKNAVHDDRQNSLF